MEILIPIYWLSDRLVESHHKEVTRSPASSPKMHLDRTTCSVPVFFILLYLGVLLDIML